MPRRGRPTWTRKIRAAVRAPPGVRPTSFDQYKLGRSPFFDPLKTGNVHPGGERPRGTMRKFAGAVGTTNFRPVEIGLAPRTLRLQRHPVPKEQSRATG